jgi:uncharacterized alkaline shock family protein YloU
MAMTAQPEQLPCGAELEALVIQVTDDQQPTDPAHQNSCPYCHTALRSLRQGWADVQALTREPVPIPPRLTAQIMARVRTLARHVTDSILLGHPRGETRISHTVLGQVIQRIATSVPGVVFASAKPIPHDPPEPGRLSVNIRLVIALDPAIDTLTHTVRHLINRRIPALTGAQLSRIDITIEDIAEPAD